MYKNQTNFVFILESPLYIHCLKRPHGPIWCWVITKKSSVYPRVILCIHRLTRGYTCTIHQKIARVTCRRRHSNFFDVFPVSFYHLFCFYRWFISLVNLSRYIIFFMARCFVWYANVAFLSILMTCSCCYIFKNSFASLKAASNYVWK